MKKNDMIKTIVESAKSYNDNLANRNLLFIFGSEFSIEWFEVVCLPENFMHLTGILPTDKSLSRVYFYNMSLNGRLAPEIIQANRDGTTQMKLSVINHALNIHINARMVGDYRGNKIRLNTEKIAGNVHACVGFVKAKEYPGLYVPNTVLREDIRDVVDKPTKKVIAIFRKFVRDAKYGECTYLAKGVHIDAINCDEIKSKFIQPFAL